MFLDASGTHSAVIGGVQRRGGAARLVSTALSAVLDGSAPVRPEQIEAVVSVLLDVDDHRAHHERGR